MTKSSVFMSMIGEGETAEADGERDCQMEMDLRAGSGGSVEVRLEGEGVTKESSWLYGSMGLLTSDLKDLISPTVGVGMELSSGPSPIPLASPNSALDKTS